MIRTLRFGLNVWKDSTIFKCESTLETIIRGHEHLLLLKYPILKEWSGSEKKGYDRLKVDKVVYFGK